ncbi:MAG: NAD(P)-dependent oxidoreductase, partial [Lewinella sp.]
ERDQLSIVADQIGSPTYAADLATAALQLAANDTPSGIYNFANSGVCSWYDFAHAIFEISGTDCLLKPISTEQYPTPAKRPNYSVLNTRKISEVTAVPRHWREALVECLGKV